MTIFNNFNVNLVMTMAMIRAAMIREVMTRAMTRGKSFKFKLILSKVLTLFQPTDTPKDMARVTIKDMTKATARGKLTYNNVIRA